MKNWWISWYHKDEFSAFELHSPWWVSGTTDDSATICAAVKAESWEAASDVIFECYDEPPRGIEFRFISERPADWCPFNERFQKADWMKWEV